MLNLIPCLIVLILVLMVMVSRLRCPEWREAMYSVLLIVSGVLWVAQWVLSIMPTITDITISPVALVVPGMCVAGLIAIVVFGTIYED